jgi:hypothetical protein
LSPHNTRRAQGRTRTGTFDHPATFCMVTRLQRSQITS